MSLRITALTDPEETSVGRRPAWLASDPDGSPAGYAFLRLFTREGQRHLAELDVSVHPAERRGRVGTLLLEAAVAAARQDGRSTVIAQAAAGSPGAAFLTAGGFRAALALTYARLPLTDAGLPAPHRPRREAAPRLPADGTTARRCCPSTAAVASPAG